MSILINKFISTMRKLLLLFVVFFLFACKQKEIQDSVPRQTNMFLTLQDTAGNDLLDPKSTNAIDTSAIKLKYLDKTGNMVELPKRNYAITKMGQPNIYHPKFIGDNYVFGMSVDNIRSGGGEYETLIIRIEWAANNIDTLQCGTMIFRNALQVCSVARGDQKWEVGLFVAPYFKKLISNGESEITMY